MAALEKCKEDLLEKVKKGEEEYKNANEEIERLKRREERNMEIIKKVKRKIEEEGEKEALTSTLKTLKRRKVNEEKAING